MINHRYAPIRLCNAYKDVKWERKWCAIDESTQFYELIKISEAMKAGEEVDGIEWIDEGDVEMLFDDDYTIWNGFSLYFKNSKSKEENEDILKSLFMVMYLIDIIVNEMENSDYPLYDVGFIQIFEDYTHIEYYGNSFNTQFDVLVHKIADAWHIDKIAMKKYDPPIPVFAEM